MFRSILDFNSSRNFMDIIDQLQSESNRHPVSQEIINQLPEFEVDVSKLDDEKKIVSYVYKILMMEIRQLFYLVFIYFIQNVLKIGLKMKIHVLFVNLN
jgi:hypothetical protein